jgi:hypothetical protein
MDRGAGDMTVDLKPRPLCAFEIAKRLKIQAAALAKLLKFGRDPESKVERASGLVECPVCGLTLSNHPYRADLKVTVDCHGRLLKL